VPVLINTLPPLLPYVRSGRLRLLGVSSAKRTAALPEAPTVGEALVPVLINTLPPLLPYVRSGRLRLLGVSSAKRTAALPEAPTVAEAGVTGYEAGIWWGLMGPAGVPPGIVGKLNAEVGAIVREPDSVKWFTAQASDPASSAPDEFSKLIVADVAKWRKVAKSAGIGPS